VRGSVRAHNRGRPSCCGHRALLTRTHLRELGLERRAVDAVFRALPVIAIPGYSRAMVRAEVYLELIERSTYHGERVRPT